MTIDLLTFGEALVEVMRTGINQPLDAPGPFKGPYPSGAPFIFAVQAARLGARVAAIGAVGNDGFGRCLIDQLREDNIDISGITTLDSHSTGVAFVAYHEDGTRDFIFHIAYTAAGQIQPEMLDPSLFNGLKCLHLMGSTLSIHDDALQTGLHAVELARNAGAQISFDPNLRPQLLPNEWACEVFKPFLDAADIIIPTADEAQILTGQSDLDAAIDVLLDHHPQRMVVVTQGAQGCTVYSQTNKTRVPGFVVDEIDPTGAGDCFDAGFLVQWLNGHSPIQSARFANACGALAVTRQGPMTGAQSYAAVQAFINANP